MFDGDPGMGKSTITNDLAARLTTGRPMPGSDVQTEPGSVLFVAGEDGVADTVKGRIAAAGGDERRIAVLTSVPLLGAPGEISVGGATRSEPITVPDHIGYIERAVREHGFRMVVIDPLMAHLSPSVKTSSDMSVRSALQCLVDLADATGIAVLLVRHLNKGEGQAMYRGGGSIGFSALARSVLLVGPQPKDPHARALASVKSNLGPTPPTISYRIVPEGEYSRIEWGDFVSLAPDALLSSGRATPVTDYAVEFLRAELSTGPRPAAEVNARAQAKGISPKALRRARGILSVEKTKLGMTEGWAWSLPSDDPSDPGEDDEWASE